MLKLEGTAVASAAEVDDGWIVDVRRRRARTHACPCGAKTRAVYDSRPRLWRHLDFGKAKVWLRYAIARVDCRRCGRVRTEQVPWARPGARQTREFEDQVAWLAQQMSKSAVATLMRCAWETVDDIVSRVVDEHLARLDSRLDGLRRIGVDEVSYRRGHEYLTVIADHHTGRVVWVARGRTQAALQSFFDALGPVRSAALEAVSCDASSIYMPVLRQIVPQARLCLDPFHVVAWCNEAVDMHYKSAPTLDTEGTRARQRAAVPPDRGVVFHPRLVSDPCCSATRSRDLETASAVKARV